MSRCRTGRLFGFFDDLINGNLGQNDDNDGKKEGNQTIRSERTTLGNDDNDGQEVLWSEADFRNEVQKRNEEGLDVSSKLAPQSNSDVIVAGKGDEEEEAEYDGYMVRKHFIVFDELYEYDIRN